MKHYLFRLTNVFPPATTFHLCLLFFRIAIAVELAVAHGFKKIGIGTGSPEVVPNPLHLPSILNQDWALTANLVFPFFVVLGLFTRAATVGILAVTLTGLLLVHGKGSVAERDIPFMYSAAYLLLLFLGPGKYSFDFKINCSLLKPL